MVKCLFIICPTDFIEHIIRQRFDGHKYFYTSLGNTFNIEKNNVNDLIKVVQKYAIEEITFILSEDNKIILDATQGQKFIGIRGFKNNYQKINEKRKMTHQMWLSHDHHTLFLSYFLIDKINKFREHLSNHAMPKLKVSAKIYSKAYDSFRAIYPEVSLSDLVRIN
tara:strand:+ start:1324 stop:1821 length:498 start_codon:yes stop_codon:yes gene_type:complete